MPFSVLLYVAQEPRETGVFNPSPEQVVGNPEAPQGEGYEILILYFCIIHQAYKFVISPSAIVTAHALISFLEL